jgi:hypothetical protein
MRLMQRASVTASLALLMPVALLSTAPPATAATSCSGTPVKTITHYQQGRLPLRVAAKTHIYYDGTYNCAVLEKVLGRGEQSEMEISICTTYGCQTDHGFDYRYHAGPVKIYGRNRCITIYATSFAPDVGYSYFVYQSGKMLCG